MAATRATCPGWVVGASRACTSRNSTRFMALEAFIFLRWSVAGQSIATGVTFGFNAGQSLALGARLAQDYDGTQGFGVDTGDQVGVAGAVFFPELADLNFGNGNGCKPGL